MPLHFVSFLLNVLSWIVIGLLVSMRIRGLKKGRDDATRFYFTTVSASFIGGLLAELANGSPEFGISLINLIIAGFAVVIAVYFAYPTYAVRITREVKLLLETYGKILRLRLQTLRGK